MNQIIGTGFREIQIMLSSAGSLRSITPNISDEEFRTTDVPDYYVECKPKSMCLYINRNFLQSQKPNPITNDDEARFMLSGMTEDTNGIPCSPWSIDVADNVPLNQDRGVFFSTTIS